MNTEMLREILSGIPIGPVIYFDTIGSTNDEAASWADAGAPDLALVVAGEQTRGRGRSGRQWFTPAGAGLAFSLVLRYPNPTEPDRLLPRLTALAGLAVSDALIRDYDLPAQIKWPNDVLVDRKKVAGILAEAYWLGDELSAAILGVGVNVAQGSAPGDGLIYPATSVEDEHGRPVDRFDLLAGILGYLLERRTTLYGERLTQDWESRLAFRGEWVQIIDQGQVQEGLLLGLNPDGSLRLKTRDSQILNILTGDVSLRPMT